MFRPLLLAAALTAAVPALAQSASPPAAACTGGLATFNGVSYACNQVDLYARLPLSAFTPNAPTSTNEVWGWTDPQTGHEIALVGLSNGVGFVDVTTPDTPVYLGKLTSATTGNNDWRTFRTDGEYLYVGSEASGHGVQVFHLARLRGVTTPQAFTHDARYTRVSNVHTLVAHNGYLYLAGTTRTTGATNPTCTGGGLHIVDVRNPLAPTFAGCYNGDGYTHEAQCLTYAGPDAQHVGKDICFAYQGQEGTFTGEVSIVDMTNKAAPVRLSSGQYPNVGYSHQGWLTPDGRRILINDEFDQSAQGARTIVMNVTDLDAPEFEFNYYGPQNTYAHNLYVVGDYAYLSNYTGGLHIVDVRQIGTGQLSEVASFDTFQQSNGYTYDGQWMNYPFFASGNVVATDITNGLFVLKATGLTVADEPVPAAGAFSLSAASPNPTAALASLALTVEAPERVRATLYDATGREVAVVFDGTVAESATLRVDTRALAAGAYVLRVAGETFSAARQISVIR